MHYMHVLCLTLVDLYNIVFHCLLSRLSLPFLGVTSEIDSLAAGNNSVCFYIAPLAERELMNMRTWKMKYSPCKAQ